MHGGQIRLAEIIRAYQEANFAVRSVNLYGTDAAAGQPRGKFDVDYPRQTVFRHWRGKAVPLVDDLTAGIYAAEDEQAYRELTKALNVKPDIIHLEQPWLLPLVLRWRKEGRVTDARVIYGSQNIEAPLKRAILKQYGVVEADAVATEIAQLEMDVCECADLVLAVSESDREALASMTNTPVILAANGIAPWHSDASCLTRWREKLPPGPFALFVGSAHPPNFSGFFGTLGESLGFLPPDCRICVVGSAGAHLPEHPSFQRWKPLNESRIRILGMLDDVDMAAVKDLAHVFILPITEGGGSNIKTAEALYSGKHVLGTPTSFRGFDRFLTMPGVNIGRSPDAFRNQLCKLLHESLPEDNPSWKNAREDLVWKRTLLPMIQAAKHLMQPETPTEMAA